MDKHNTGGIGGVKDWIIGFFNRIKAHNSTHAELQALQADLNLAYEKRLAPLEIDTDSTDIIKLLQHNISPAYTNTILECRYLLKKLGNPVIRHSFREDNKVAHLLCKWGSKHHLSSTTTILHSPPDAPKKAIQDEKNEVLTTRLVSSSICNILAVPENLSIIPAITNSDEVCTNDFSEFDEFDYHDDVGGEEEVSNIIRRKRGGENVTSGSNKKLAKGNGPVDVFLQKRGTLRQINIKDSCDKEARATTIQKIARFFYDAGIPFNVARLKSFKDAVEAIGSYGPNLKPPIYHELRVPLLRKEVVLIDEIVNKHREEWVKYGCSIMADGWKDRKQRTLINFLMNSPYGIVFLESIDASSFVKTGEKLYELLDRYVERVGEQNVIQVISDNGSNFALAGQLLQRKRKHIYWTPCAAHCIDLMLEDIGKIPNIKKTIQRAIALVSFIYGHTGVINMMRDFTKNKELVKYRITRFATSFLTLQRLHCQKTNLRAMFTSERWVNSSWSKTSKGKSVAHFVLMTTFWNQVVYILKIMGPLVKVLRLADNEKNPAMRYIYEAMDRAKEAIVKAFDGNSAKYKDIFKIINERWSCQLHHPLHAVGHYLNPEYFYQNPTIENCKEVTDGLYACKEKLVPSIEVQDKIISEIPLYTRAEQQFGLPIAKKIKNDKIYWLWNLYGNSAPHLQKLAIRILGLTASSAGCERGDVARASGSEDMLTYTRRQKRQSEVIINASSSRAPRADVVENESDFNDLDEEEIEGYMSSDTDEGHPSEENYIEEYDYISD
ncbi:uncharacterized protein [Nicotiana sylvestris]|uniref:uncharacterized protein n=1 Tax=Nicotiana sylvestris TaxID=4096 RepID=UPI00388CC5B1